MAGLVNNNAETELAAANHKDCQHVSDWVGQERSRTERARDQYPIRQYNAPSLG